MEEKEKTEGKPEEKKSEEITDGVVKVNLNQDEKDKKQESEQGKEDVEDDKGEEQEEILTPIVDEEEKTESKEEGVQDKVVDNPDNPDGKEEVETTEEEVEEEAKEAGVDLPENIQDAVKFINETGGTLEDYVRLNADYDNIDDKQLLRTYYKQTKPNLSNDDIDFLIEDSFNYDEEEDEERDIRRKKVAYKEAVSQAKDHLTSLKDKYYKEVKGGSRLTDEQKEAVDFYNKYKKEDSVSKERTRKSREHFEQQTEKLFSEDFKGFDFNVGDDKNPKKYRYNVKDAAKIKENQKDFTKVLGGYFDEKSGQLKDASGYHKSLFAASDPDALAKHFYEQGRAETIKELEKDSKNINMDGRKANQEYISHKGLKVKVLDGKSSSKLRIKT